MPRKRRDASETKGARGKPGRRGSAAPKRAGAGRGRARATAQSTAGPEEPRSAPRGETGQSTARPEGQIETAVGASANDDGDQHERSAAEALGEARVRGPAGGRALHGRGTPEAPVRPRSAPGPAAPSRGRRVVKVALTQMACSPVPAANRARQLALVERAAEQGAQIVCTQELFTSQYFCQTEDHRFFQLAETIPGPSTEALGRLARKHHLTIVASLFEKRASGLYHNTAAIIDTDGAIQGLYRKMHIPDDPLYYEKFYFTPGDLGFRAWDTAHGKIGVLICWDQWFPEGARLTALQGAEILFYPTAIGWHPKEKAEYGRTQHDAWELMQRSHAVANGCFVCAPNRIGHEVILDAAGDPVSRDGIQFWGQSFVAGPNGQVVARAAVETEEVLVVPCDLEQVEFSRTHWPFLRDRRIDAYAQLDRRFIDRHAG